MDELLQAKLNLYMLLIKKDDNNELDGNEIDVLFHLSKDIDVQEILEKAKYEPT